MTDIFTLIGTFLFFEALLTKWGFYYWLALKGANSRFRLLYELTNCQFCLTFWFSAIVYIVLYALDIVNSLNGALFIASNGLIHLFRRNAL